MKNHYFIGHMLDDNNNINILKNIQKNIRKRYKLNNFHFNNKLYVNFVYLGYYDDDIIKEFMNKVGSILMNEIAEKISELNCYYKSYKIYNDKSYYRISILIDDISNIIIKTIIPYLFKEAIMPIFNKNKIMYPSIDLIYYKSSDIPTNKNTITMDLPKNKFKITSLSLIRGSPTQIRSGLPSKHDQLHLDEVYKYRVLLKPLLSVNKNSNKEINQEINQKVNQEINHKEINDINNVTRTRIQNNNNNVTRTRIQNNNNNAN